MYDFIRTAAFSFGFKEVFFLAPLRLDAWHMQAERIGVGASLHFDPVAAYPNASCILLLVYPYAPFPAGERLSAYYLASQRGYLASKGFMGALTASGISCEMASVPARALALANGIGVQGKNGLLRIGGYGSRFALYTVATDACAPQVNAPFTPPCPANCDACLRACPMGAIRPDGLDATHCMRYFMDGAEYPFLIYEAQRTHMGCELCQAACPQNAHLAFGAPSEAERSAFALPRLIAGDAKEARTLVGRNMTGNGKLTAEAICFSAREGLFEEEIRAAMETTSFPAVKRAARWALQRYFHQKITEL